MKQNDKEAEEEGEPTEEGKVEEEPEFVGPEKGHNAAVVYSHEEVCSVSSVSE
jgi:hypothetical protein